MLGVRPFVFGVLFVLGCVGSASNARADFIYEYHLSTEIAFDFSKSNSVELGTLSVTNPDETHKKFRFIPHAPYGYLYNRKNKTCYSFGLIYDTTEPRVLDSVFWALLDSATYYYAVPAMSSLEFTVFMNVNAHPQPEQIVHYITENHDHLEYHLFDPRHRPRVPLGERRLNACIGAPPDFTLQTIRVLRP